MIKSAIYPTPMGYFCIAYEDEYVVFLKKNHEKNIQNLGIKSALTEKVFQELSEYFEGKRKVFTFKYILKGTEFQKKVWQALCDIPYGETRSYKDIAVAVGNEKACRAVGLANNKNPITIAVPCHRVIGAGGKLVGYAGGLDMKKHLLEMEKKHL